jgi:hypothetical protein
MEKGLMQSLRDRLNEPTDRDSLANLSVAASAVLFVYFAGSELWGWPITPSFWLLGINIALGFLLLLRFILKAALRRGPKA